MRLNVWAVAAAVAAASTCFAAPVALDLSSAFNHDAVGTQGEHDFSTYYRSTDVWTGVARSNAVASTLYDTMRGTWPGSVTNSHTVAQYENNGRCFMEQALADRTTGTGKVGLPPDYRVGPFELGKGVNPPADYSRYGRAVWSNTGWPDVTNTYPREVKNTVRISRGTATVTLTPPQQAKYASMNVLITSWRSKDTATYTARIEVRYAGGAWETAWEDVDVITVANTPGGSFCTAGGDGTMNGTWEDTDGVDTNAFGNAPYATVWPVAATNCTRYCTNAGSPGFDSLSTGNRYLWTWDSDPGTPGNQGIALDARRVLEALRFTATSNSSARGHRLYLYAVNAEPAKVTWPSVLMVK